MDIITAEVDDEGVVTCDDGNIIHFQAEVKRSKTGILSPVVFFQDLYRRIFPSGQGILNRTRFCPVRFLRRREQAEAGTSHTLAGRVGQEGHAHDLMVELVPQHDASTTTTTRDAPSPSRRTTCCTRDRREEPEVGKSVPVDSKKVRSIIKDTMLKKRIKNKKQQNGNSAAAAANTATTAFTLLLESVCAVFRRVIWKPSVAVVMYLSLQVRTSQPHHLVSHTTFWLFVGSLTEEQFLPGSLAYRRSISEMLRASRSEGSSAMRQEGSVLMRGIAFTGAQAHLFTTGTKSPPARLVMLLML
ncbi:unnamed protein product [Amoebophrya sp. A120]|nr:unnamed protein product [Amoebophrya sp. A120]|eukprot:GSA120T00012203001.1